MLGLTGATEMEDRVAAVTVMAVAPETATFEIGETAPEVAVKTTTPAAMVVPRPKVLTVASEILLVVQMTCLVIS